MGGFLFLCVSGQLVWFALTETKLKGNGEVSWYWVNGIIAGVQEMEWNLNEWIGDRVRAGITGAF